VKLSICLLYSGRALCFGIKALRVFLTPTAVLQHQPGPLANTSATSTSSQTVPPTAPLCTSVSESSSVLAWADTQQLLVPWRGLQHPSGATSFPLSLVGPGVHPQHSLIKARHFHSRAQSHALRSTFRP